ncbi:MAG: hypothetical protein GY940_22820 [bacterium]|nr:hypothetical protein [bacterium]
MANELIQPPALTAAVKLMDRYSLGQAIGEFDLLVNGELVDPVKNRSGYYLFFDAPGDFFDLRIISQYYFETERRIVIGDLDLLNPVVNIPLTPLPSYPFPGNATLIRGRVVDGNQFPILGAGVRVDWGEGKKTVTLTGRGGEFVLYFNGLTGVDVAVHPNSRKRFIKGTGTPPPASELLELEVQAKNGPDTGSYLLDRLEEGTVVSLDGPIPLA